MRDKIALMCVSRRLRSICETPSLWRKFEWPNYDVRDELCVKSVVKWCGEHVKFLSFPDHVTPSKAVKMLSHCENVLRLDIPTTKLDNAQLRNVLDRMNLLQKLDIKWSFEIWHILKLTGNHGNLKELTIRVFQYMKHFADSTGAFVASTHLWIKEWMLKGFIPQNINFVNPGFECNLLSELLRVWLKLNCNSPAGRTGFLKYYNKTWFNLPVIPDFQLEFGQAAVLPMVKTSHFGILGLDSDWVLVTECVHENETVYKVACITPSWLGLVRNKNFSYVDAPFLKFVIHFDLSCCEYLLSDHLEQLAVTCPNLQQLNVMDSDECLRNLRGLQAIATYCDNLQGLNLLGIPVTEIENQVQLWQILSNIQLTHLAVCLCVMEPVVVNDRNKLIEVYQKFVVLKALEFHSTSSPDYCCYEHEKLSGRETLLLSYFPVLEFCIINNIHLLALQHIINNCKELKYLNCSSSVNGRSLLPVYSNYTLIQLISVLLTTL